jgi:hypothetical protein
MILDPASPHLLIGAGSHPTKEAMRRDELSRKRLELFQGLPLLSDDSTIAKNPIPPLGCNKLVLIHMFLGLWRHMESQTGKVNPEPVPTRGDLNFGDCAPAQKSKSSFHPRSFVFPTADI